MDAGDKLGLVLLGLWVLYGLAMLLLCVAVIRVAWHFVAKFW